MGKSLLFLPDISGFTKFVQSTEVEHSQHVIAELLEILIAANQIDLHLAEIEGDALFYFKEKSVPTLDEILQQVERMFVDFYSHLKLLEKNRICPCNACTSAPNLQLKIIAHVGELQFINVQNNRKPFGKEVIEAHRLMKNDVQSDNYVLFSQALIDELKLARDFQHPIFNFHAGKNTYDGKEVAYQYAVIDQEKLYLKPFIQSSLVEFEEPPTITVEQQFDISADELFEYITNFKYRPHWIKGVDYFEYKEHEVNRIGTEHACVINQKHFNFTTVIKPVRPDQLVFGELSYDTPFIDEIYQFYIITPISDQQSHMEIQIYPKVKSSIKRLIFSSPPVKAKFRSDLRKSLTKLKELAAEKSESGN